MKGQLDHRRGGGASSRGEAGDFHVALVGRGALEDRPRGGGGGPGSAIASRSSVDETDPRRGRRPSTWRSTRRSSPTACRACSSSTWRRGRAGVASRVGVVPEVLRTASTALLVPGGRAAAPRRRHRPAPRRRGSPRAARGGGAALWRAAAVRRASPRRSLAALYRRRSTRAPRGRRHEDLRSLLRSLRQRRRPRRPPGPARGARSARWRWSGRARRGRSGRRWPRTACATSAWPGGRFPGFVATLPALLATRGRRPPLRLQAAAGERGHRPPQAACGVGARSLLDIDDWEVGFFLRGGSGARWVARSTSATPRGCPGRG